MKTDELHDVWLRDRAGESISAAERSALDEAMRQNAPFRTRLSEDLWVDGALRAMGRSERDGAAFTQTTIRRLQHEQSGARFVADTVRRAQEMSSRPHEKALRKRSGWRWAAALAASLAVLAAGSLIYRSIISPPPPGTANIAHHNGHSERRVAGHIAETQGTVEVRVGDEATSVAATPGMALFEGARVLTGDGGCRLALARGDVVVTVMASSELMLKGGGSDGQYDCEVNLTHGELQAEVRRKGTRFAVVSVAGKAEAIGTAFKVKLQAQTEEKESKMNKTQISMLTTVLSGVVLISNPSGTMTARAGDAVTVTAATAPELATNAPAPRTRTDPAAVVITPRTWNAWEAFDELDWKGGPRVVVLGVPLEVSLKNSWNLPWTVGMRSPTADPAFFGPPRALCLLVPPELRFVPVEGRKLIEAVAASRRLKTAWAQDGRVALLYEGVPDAEVDGVRKDLESPDQAIRREAAWRAGWMRDVRVVPLLVKAAKNADAKTARQAVEGLRRLNWGAVVALDETAVDLIAAELDLKAWEDNPKRRAAPGELGAFVGNTTMEEYEDSYKRRAALGGLAYAGGEKVLALLENALTDKDTGVRQAAAKALGYVGGEKAVVLLEKALGDNNFYLVVAAVRALARVGDDKALALVGKAMTDGRFPDRGFCFYAAEPLACMGGEKALPLLEKALANQDGNVRYHAAGALGRVGGDKALALIEKALGDRSGHGEVRFSAINALGLVGGDKALALLEKLFNAGGNDRRDAASALAHMGGDKALALLEKALDDKSALGLERKGAAESLRNYGGDKALALIEKALADQRESVRESAAAALGTVGDEKALALIEKTIADKRNNVMSGGNAAAGAAADSLVGYMDSDKGMALIEKTLRNSKPGVGRAAAIAVFHAVGGRALPLIEKAYAAGEVLNDAEMRRAAVLALARIGPHKALALLAKALDDPDKEVRSVTAQVLTSVPPYGEGGGKVRDLLLGRLAVEKDENVLPYIQSRLGMDFHGDPAIEKGLLSSLGNTLTNESARVRRFAVEELGNLGGGKVRDLLLGWLAVEKDKNVLASIESRLRMDFPDDPAVEKALKDYEASER